MALLSPLYSSFFSPHFFFQIVYVPVVKPRLMRVFGVDFTDKAVWYLMAIPVSFEKSCGSFSHSHQYNLFKNILCKKKHTHIFPMQGLVEQWSWVNGPRRMWNILW
jgi:hypothetical protein